MDIERMAEEFERASAADGQKPSLPAEAAEPKAPAEIPNGALTAETVVGGTQQEVLRRAQGKINSERILDKHASKIAKITDKAMEVDADRAELSVRKQDAANKADRQEIANRLLVLKAEAKRLKREQRHLTKEQKADHKARDKEARWEVYKGKLQKMHYDYVPNPLILHMLLFFDGAKSFFDGIGTLSTAILKALKWVIAIGLILIVILTIPVTREWLFGILQGE